MKTGAAGVLRSVLDGLITACAAVAAALLAFIFLSVIFDVSMRYLVRQPPAWPVPAAEYSLHIAVTLGAPFVLRQRGHVVVDLIAAALPGALQAFVRRVTMALAAAVCGIFAAFAASAGAEAWANDFLDVRSILMPQWLLFAPLAVAFAIMAAQFLIFAVEGGGAGRRSEAEI